MFSGRSERHPRRGPFPGNPSPLPRAGARDVVGCLARGRGPCPNSVKKDAPDMLSTDLGACEWFVWDLRRSNLIDRGQLDQVIGEFLSKNPGAEPPMLAEFLVRQGILTEFQAERLLQGKTQGFVLGPFTLMDALGSGSMATFYKPHSKPDGHWSAVKVLPRRSM